MLNNYLFIIFLFVCLIEINILAYFIFLIINKYGRRYYIKNFADYITLLELFEDKAYEIIYKDKLLVYSLEAVKINDEEFSKISKEFSKLVIKLMGPELQKDFENMFSLETLFFNMMQYFNKKYEEDEIRKTAVDNLMNKNIEDIGDNKYEQVR